MLAEVGRVLLVFLVLSVVFESALTPIFNWRVFRKRCAGKGVKVPITVILAFVIFWSYGLDIFHDLLMAMEYNHAGGHERLPSLGGQALTALLIAGGSSGIFTIFQRLGIRSPVEGNTKQEEK